MTLENCKRLLAHYEEVGNAAAAADMRENLARRGVQPDKPSKKK